MKFLCDAEVQPLSKRIIILLCAIIVAYSGLMFFRLGTCDIPQSYVRFEPGDIKSININVNDIQSILMWSKYGAEPSKLIFSVDGNTVCNVDRWMTMWAEYRFENVMTNSSVLQLEYDGSHYIDIYELAFLDKDGNLMSYGTFDDLDYIHDEAYLIDQSHSVLTSLYFDELLYSDTADHYFVDGLILEKSHPPMGKNFIALGVLLFGHNTLGYRFFGAVFGILTLLVMFFLARKILKKNAFALLVTILVFCESMYYVQSRVCAIDIYVLFFILLSYLYMICYAQTNIRRQEIGFLGLSGLCFGMACASKWIGCYAGIGLAIVFFVAFLHKRKDYSLTRRMDSWMCTLLWCCLFFVIMPITIYVMSYLPMLWKRSDGIVDFFGKVWANQLYMWNWHANYVGDQFNWQSAWYGWPFSVGSFFYFNPSLFSARSDFWQFIVLCGNPFIWIGGLISVCLCSVYLVKTFVARREVNYTLFVIVVMYVCQYVPWWFIDRPLFIYHYFCAGTISILCLVFVLMKLWQRSTLYKILVGCYAGISSLWFFIMFPFFNGLLISENYALLAFLLAKG